MAATATPLFVAQDIVTLMPNPAPVVALLALMTAPVVATALELETNRMLPVVSEVDPSVRASLVVSEFHSHSCALAAALLMVREAVAVSSEGGAAEEGEVEAGEAVHGLLQEGGGRLDGRSGPEQGSSAHLVKSGKKQRITRTPQHQRARGEEHRAATSAESVSAYCNYLAMSGLAARGGREG